jgi:predicted enzyme related to lactoylglutathione lyase
MIPGTVWQDTHEFSVDDVRATYRSLTSRGVRFRHEPHLIAKLPDRQVWMAFFDDTEGNTLALMSEPKV